MFVALAAGELAPHGRVPWSLIALVGDQERRNAVFAHRARLTTTATVWELTIMAASNVARCAYCGRRGDSLFNFVLLAEACRKFDVCLKVPNSTAFHEPCSRRAYSALLKQPVAAFLQGGIK
jgi:hypothetical protein